MMAGKVWSEPLADYIDSKNKGLIRFLGQSEYLKSTSMTSPLAFNLSLDQEPLRLDSFSHMTADDSRLMEMLAAQAAHRTDEAATGNEEVILANDTLSEADKTTILQKSLHMAASNGDIDRIKRLVSGKAKQYIDINAADEEGSAPLIYASCFVRPLCPRRS